MELMSLALVSGGGNVGMFQERCKLLADIVCFLDSCFDLSVKSSIFCKYATDVLELGRLLELRAIDVDAAHLHCLGLAVVDRHVVFFTGSVQAICMLLQLLFIFICKALANNISVNASGCGVASFVFIVHGYNEQLW